MCPPPGRPSGPRCEIMRRGSKGILSQVSVTCQPCATRKRRRRTTQHRGRGRGTAIRGSPPLSQSVPYPHSARAGSPSSGPATVNGRGGGHGTCTTAQDAAEEASRQNAGRLLPLGLVFLSTAETLAACTLPVPGDSASQPQAADERLSPNEPRHDVDETPICVESRRIPRTVEDFAQNASPPPSSTPAPSGAYPSKPQWAASGRQHEQQDQD
jgi:hypothetical protein